MEEDFPELEKLKNDLYNLRENKMQGILVRSRANIIENGEKPSQYFCNLESNHYTSKVMNVLEHENGEIITKQKDILKETRKYYENLYSSKEHNDVDILMHMQNTDIPKLEEQEALRLEGFITLEEAGQTLKHMKNDKSPGTSGFSAEFFKVFWKQLGAFIVRAINFGFVRGELSVTQQ